jgi:hypothetical protein
MKISRSETDAASRREYWAPLMLRPPRHLQVDSSEIRFSDRLADLPIQSSVRSSDSQAFSVLSTCIKP